MKEEASGGAVWKQNWHWSGKGESGEFIALTNFGVRILKFIEALAQLPDYKGFLVDRKRTAVKEYCSNAVFVVHVQFHCLE